MEINFKVETQKRPVSNNTVAKVIRKSLAGAIKNGILEDKTLDSYHYNDYSKSGIVIHATW